MNFKSSLVTQGHVWYIQYGAENIQRSGRYRLSIEAETINAVPHPVRRIDDPNQRRRKHGPNTQTSILCFAVISHQTTCLLARN